MYSLGPLATRRWFDTSIPVDRRSYVLSGLTLVLVKYALEAILVAVTTGRFWSPVTFLVPFASIRSSAAGEDASGLLVVLGVLSLPFLYVGLSMSVRRAANAGYSPFVGLGFVVPVVNYLVMIGLALAPDRPRPESPDRISPSSIVSASIVGAVSACAVGVGTAAIILALTAKLGGIGGSLFFLTPVAMGTVCGYVFNRGGDRGLRRTLALATIAIVVSCLSLLLFMIEGGICILLVLPICIPTVLIGAAIGRLIATSGGTDRSLAFVFALPAFAAFPPLAPSTQTHHVRTEVEVDAPPAVVFEQVVSFAPIDSPPPWYFRTGIASPLRARIEGSGVGAIRYCEFTTGAFVEPITAWEPGRRLAFDVTSSPDPMEEWSPFRIRPDHLTTTMRSRRGEFLLTELPGGRTRLVGHTEYYLGLAPDAYFGPIADQVIHLIHLRVLEHVARTSERRVARTR